jgi:hypothetical protein
LGFRHPRSYLKASINPIPQNFKSIIVLYLKHKLTLKITMEQSISAFLIGAGVGAYGLLCGNKACKQEIEAERTKRRDVS